MCSIIHWTTCDSPNNEAHTSMQGGLEDACPRRLASSLGILSALPKKFREVKERSSNLFFDQNN